MPDRPGRPLTRSLKERIPPGKTMLQAIDVDEAVRVDVFNDGGLASRRRAAPAGLWDIVDTGGTICAIRLIELPLPSRIGGKET
jgi:hypothetical protein